MFKNKFKSLINSITSYNDIFLNKNLAKLGDNYINFIYSLARSIRTKNVSGQKVAGKILMQSIRDSELNKYLPSRLSSHDIADAVEALMVYIWLAEKMSFNEMIEILVAELNMGNVDTRKEEFDTAILAFTKLINEISKLDLF